MIVMSAIIIIYYNFIGKMKEYNYYEKIKVTIFSASLEVVGSLSQHHLESICQNNYNAMNKGGLMYRWGDIWLFSFSRSFFGHRVSTFCALYHSSECRKILKYTNSYFNAYKRT